MWGLEFRPGLGFRVQGGFELLAVRDGSGALNGVGAWGPNYKS